MMIVCDARLSTLLSEKMAVKDAKVLEEEVV